MKRKRRRQRKKKRRKRREADRWEGGSGQFQSSRRPLLHLPLVLRSPGLHQGQRRHSAAACRGCTSAPQSTSSYTPAARETHRSVRWNQIFWRQVKADLTLKASYYSYSVKEPYTTHVMKQQNKQHPWPWILVCSFDLWLVQFFNYIMRTQTTDGDWVTLSSATPGLEWRIQVFQIFFNFNVILSCLHFDLERAAKHWDWDTIMVCTSGD